MLLFGQFAEVLNKRGLGDVSSILGQLWGDLSSLDLATWETLLHDSTSPIPRATTLDESLLDKGLGPIGKVEIPQEVWDSLMPRAFGRQSSLDALKNKPLSDHAVKMLRAIARDNPSVFRASDGGRGLIAGLLSFPRTRSRRVSSSIWLNLMLETHVSHLVSPYPRLRS